MRPTSPHWFRFLQLYLLVYSAIGDLVSAQDSFTRIFSDPAVAGINSTVLAWGDFNNDNFQDLYVSARTGSSLLYSNNGNGTFTRVVTGPVAADSGNCFGATWADYDNDGHLDLFVGVNNLGNDWLYHNNGRGGFTKITAGAIVSSGANANNCAWGDYDNDGFVDLFVANSDQNDFLYHNNGDGTFARITTNAIALKTGNSQGGSWGDYDNDGLLDLFVSRVNEPNLLYHNDGDGAFSRVTSGIVVQDVSVGQGTSWGDYDNDGFLDLFVANPNARNFLYRNNRDGTFAKITNGAVVTDIGNSRGCGWADYDNDGYLDLFVANLSGNNFLYRNNGNSTFTRIIDGVVPTDSPSAVSGAWADYNNDGFADLFVTELNTVTNRLYRNNGNSNNWLTVRCTGRSSNRSAIGARVSVKAIIAAKEVWQMREISGGGGLGSQNDLRAGFGLGDAARAESLRVRWPSGVVQEFRDVNARQFLDVTEPDVWVTPRVWEGQAGEPAIFNVTTLIPGPIALQWRLNGVDLPGETSDSFRITNVRADDAGVYTVRLVTPTMTVDSPVIKLTGPVVITQSPTNTTARPDSNAVFSVRASGVGPLSYQWRFEGIEIRGATNSELVLAHCQPANAGSYTVVVSNSFGSVVSGEATLGILINPVVTMQPVSQSVVQGGNVTLSVGISGSPAPFTFEWRRGPTPIWTNITSEPMSFLTLTNMQPAHAGNYRVVIKNAAFFQPGLLSSNGVLTVVSDTDGDGLPDEWEAAHQLDPADPTDADADFDADGFSNRQEHTADTDPRDAASCLRINVIAGLGDGRIRLEFNARPTRTYTVERRDPAADEPWSRLIDVAAALTNRAVRVEDVSPSTEGQRFYRVITPRALR